MVGVSVITEIIIDVEKRKLENSTQPIEVLDGAFLQISVCPMLLKVSIDSERKSYTLKKILLGANFWFIDALDPSFWIFQTACTTFQ
jgi:hypothetical protein